MRKLAILGVLALAGCCPVCWAPISPTAPGGGWEVHHRQPHWPEIFDAKPQGRAHDDPVSHE